MRALLATLTTLMFVGRALPADALTLRDIGHSVSEQFQDILDWLGEWLSFHLCIFGGACEIWDLSIGFLILDFIIAFCVVHGTIESFSNWRAYRRPLKAAKQGHSSAQHNLGWMYREGESVTKDYVQAYAWWSIAVAQGEEWAKSDIDNLENVMTSDQIAEAQKLSSEYWEKYVVPFQKN